MNNSVLHQIRQIRDNKVYNMILAISQSKVLVYGVCHGAGK
jgi:hypothetical protein